MMITYRYVSLKILKSIYFANCYLSYCRPFWAQHCSTIQQSKAVRIINFQPRNFHASPLFKQNSCIKFQDKIGVENVLFVRKYLNNLSPTVFNTCFTFSSDQHSYETSDSTQADLVKLFSKTNSYGKDSITVNAVESWSKIKKTKKYATERWIHQ